MARPLLIGVLFVKTNGGMSIRGSPVGIGVVVVSGGKMTTGRPTGLFSLGEQDVAERRPVPAASDFVLNLLLGLGERST